MKKKTLVEFIDECGSIAEAAALLDQPYTTIVRMASDGLSRSTIFVVKENLVWDLYLKKLRLSDRK